MKVKLIKSVRSLSDYASEREALLVLAGELGYEVVFDE